jgi:hypothetical protein
MTAWVAGGTAAFISAGQNDTGVQATSFNDNRVLQSGLSTGDSDRQFALKFSVSGCPAAGCSLMVAWTAHFASAVDWGTGNGAGSITGSSFHMTLIGVDNGDGTGGGNRDRSANWARIWSRAARL